ncbi:MAG TPA: phosphate ABC transporter permease subunit PstC, partial [Acidimicrobiia bacterium]|nr:phosphate ABC transporter permease subunit PstC [Acidimicrobiia bacterium]
APPSTTRPPEVAAQPPTPKGPLHGGSRLADQTFRWVCLASGFLVLVVLGLILFSTTKEAMPAFRHEGLRFLTSTNWNPADGHFGALAFIYGTLVVSAIALVIAVPVSIGLALFITELAPKRLRTPVTYLIDLLAAIPSVVYGLWGILVFGPWIGKQGGLYDHIGRLFGSVPFVGAMVRWTPTQRNIMTAGIILAVMITPIVTSISKEVFATVPRDQKEAAWGLGATRFEMIRGAVFPYSRTGLVGAVMLGLGRAMGETIAVALVIGSSPAITAHLFGPGDAMAAVVANQFGEASGTHRAALIGLGVVLFVMTVLVNLLARRVTSRADRRLAGGKR